MVKKKHGVIIETPMEARQAEPGPSILLLLFISVCSPSWAALPSLSVA
jgi:hypothetical protein